MRSGRIHHVHLTLLLTASLTAGCGLFGGGNVFDLTVGDCFADAQGAALRDVQVTDCAEPHDNEVFHVVELPDGDVPDDDALLAAAEAACLPAFEAYVGTEYAASRLEAFPIAPTAASWAGGDREVVCVLRADDRSPLEGSMRDSGV